MLEEYYEVTPEIINLIVRIGKLLGFVDASYLKKPQTTLRRENRVKTIHSSLAIEGNTLTLDQVSTLLENKRVVGPARDIQEVINAIQVYEQLHQFDAFDQKSNLRAHEILMRGLIEKPGKYRTGGVGIFKGEQVAHLAPPAWNVHHLMTNLFHYLKDSKDHPLIKSCVFHYEMEFIHPFEDGNGRMGRLWQTLILMRENPVFEFLPVEEQIKQKQQSYYDTLAQADKDGISTHFVEFMLSLIAESLEVLISKGRQPLSGEERIAYFVEHFLETTFSRADYLEMFKDISTSTASRDLNKGVEMGLFTKTGDKRNTVYTLNR